MHVPPLEHLRIDEDPYSMFVEVFAAKAGYLNFDPMQAKSWCHSVLEDSFCDLQGRIWGDQYPAAESDRGIIKAAVLSKTVDLQMPQSTRAGHAVGAFFKCRGGLGFLEDGLGEERTSFVSPTLREQGIPSLPTVGSLP